ncbi:DUF3027 domain-containing protein [Flindersiella endophytica]
MKCCAYWVVGSGRQETRDRELQRARRDPRPMDPDPEPSHRRPEYRESWYDEQCGGCRFWIPLAGSMGSDYGACANSASPFDGTIRFEHDGCDVFEQPGRWATPDDV